VGGIVELHTGLYDEDYDEIWFSGVDVDLSTTRKIMCADGTEISALSYDDGLLYTAIHLIKHFLGKGIGIRHFSDVLLYINKHRNEIDLDKFVNSLKNNKFYKLFNMCVKVGIKYLGFDAELFKPYFEVTINQDEEQKIAKIMKDIFNGGAFGKDNETDFIAILNQKKLGEKYNKHNKKKQIKRFAGLFSYGYMLSSYPWLKKYPFLLPVAWVKKICMYIFKPDKSVTVAIEGKTIQTNDKIDERIEFMKELDVI